LLFRQTALYEHIEAYSITISPPEAFVAALLTQKENPDPVIPTSKSILLITLILSSLNFWIPIEQFWLKLVPYLTAGMLKFEEHLVLIAVAAIEFGVI
jgi:hypothetical protein